MRVSMTLDPDEPLESISAVLAMIAWPEALPDGERVAFAQAALVAHLLRLAAEADDMWAWRKQHLKPGYLLMEPAEVRRSYKLTANRLTAALKAARAARPFIGEVLAGRPLPLPPSVSHLSLNAVIPFVLGDDDETDAHAFEHRVFRRQLPVLHLAVALEQALMAAEAETERDVSLEALMLTPEFLPWFVERARQLEPAVLAIRRFKVDLERLVRVRLAG
jgi:hypothetical protein